MATLVPLPRRALSVGETDDVPMSFPFNAGGSPLTVTGVVHVKLEAMTGGVAVLGIVYDVAKVDVPKELTGTYSASLTGSGTVRFDPVERALVRSDLNAKMSMRANDMSMDMQTVVVAERRRATR